MGGPAPSKGQAHGPDWTPAGWTEMARASMSPAPPRQPRSLLIVAGSLVACGRGAHHFLSGCLLPPKALAGKVPGPGILGCPQGPPLPQAAPSLPRMS